MYGIAGARDIGCERKKIDAHRIRSSFHVVSEAMFNDIPTPQTNTGEPAMDLKSRRISYIKYRLEYYDVRIIVGFRLGPYYGRGQWLLSLTQRRVNLP